MSQITERFELQTRLAVGNAGIVYRGIDAATRRRVALKLLNEDLAHPLDGPALVRDAARVRRTAGNNIAQILEVIDDEAGVVLVSEYADGPSWVEAAAARRLDSVQALDVAAQFLSALAVGEAIKVPHGELKPANLVLGELPGGRLFVWVLDWGLSRYRPAPPPDALLWMAPEQLAFGPASTAGDLFAMGACLCWLLTGKVPVAGATREQLSAAWRQFPADALRQVRPDLPPKFTKWVAGLLEVNPKARFATVAQARAALVPLQPPAPPILPEIFRPRPKAPNSTVITPARPARPPATRTVAAPRVVEPVLVETPAVTSATPPAADGVVRRSPWLLVGGAVLVFLAGFGAAWPFLHRPPAPAAAAPAPVAAAPISPVPAPALYPTEPLNTPKPVAKPVAAKVAAAPAAGPAAKGLIATDRMAYTAGSPLDKQKGGVGWTSSWNAPRITLRAGSLRGGRGEVSGTSCHAEFISADEITLHRALGARAAFVDDAKGGTWWFSFIVAHASAAGGAKGGALEVNFFSETQMSDLLHLTVLENGFGLTLAVEPGPAAVALPGPPEEPKRLVARVKATPAAAGKYDLAVELWANPVLAAFAARRPPPLLSTTVREAVLPSKFGIVLQKKKSGVSTTTGLDAFCFGRSVQDVLD